MEIIDRRVFNPTFTAEQPLRSALVTLPIIELQNRQIRLGMHTDTLTNLMRTLASRSDLPNLLIQVRILTPDQWIKLSSHPACRFFMNGRLARIQQQNQEEVISCLVPNDINLTADQASDLLELPFSPETLTDELGFEYGFCRASLLQKIWLDTGNVNNLLPYLGGCNEFLIGSNQLNPEQLRQIADNISVRLKAQDAHYLNSSGQIGALNIPLLTNKLYSSQYNALSINPKKDDDLFSISKIFKDRDFYNINPKKDDYIISQKLNLNSIINFKHDFLYKKIY